MSFALWSILIAAALPLAWTIVAKAGLRYDNRCPREGLAAATGYRQRANWAQQNAWEAFAPYAVAMVIALVQQVPAHQLNWVAYIFIILRVLHGLMYLANQAAWRSLVWLGGFACVLYLFVAAAVAG